MHRTWLTAALATGLALVGCEERVDYSSLKLVDVTGKITLDGQPLAGVTVRFEGPPNRFADGKSDAVGKYRLMYDSNQPGCMPGEKVVRVLQSGGEGDDGGGTEGADGRVAAAPPKIPAKYGRSSELKADVSATNKSFDFDLKSQP